MKFLKVAVLVPILSLSLGACASPAAETATPTASSTPVETVETEVVEYQDARLDQVLSKVLEETSDLTIPDYSSERAYDCNLEILLSNLQGEVTEIASSCLIDTADALALLTPDINVRIETAVDALDKGEDGKVPLSEEYLRFRGVFSGTPSLLEDLGKIFFVSCDSKNLVDPDFSAAEGENCQTVVYQIMGYVQIWNTTRVEYLNR